MKIIRYFMISIMGIILCACNDSPPRQDNDLSANKIYHFYQPTCSHCHEAIQYINSKYPNLKMEIINISADKQGYELFIKCAQKFNLGNQIGTPLFCIGDNYIMGWSPASQSQFDEYAQPFLQ